MNFWNGAFLLFFLSLGSTLELTAQKTPPARPEGGPDVTVVNTPSNPVPVAGTVTVGNTGTNPVSVRVVNDNNTPSVVSGNVTVSNSAGPLLVRDSYSAGKQPLHFSHVDVRYDYPFTNIYSVSTSYTVPAGKRLVIESLSAEIDAVKESISGQPPGKKFYIRVTTPTHVYPGNCCLSVTNHVFLPLTYGWDFGTSEFFLGSMQTRLYVESGKTVTLTAHRNRLPGAIESERVSFFFSGYLVDL